MQTLLQDFRYGIRILMKNPGFSAVAVLTLALGIGANTAIFSVVNAVLLRPLPFREPGRLVAVWEGSPKQGYEENPPAAANFLDWRAQNRVFEQMAIFDSYFNRFNLTAGDRPEQVVGVAISANLFQVLGVSPLLGRAFLPEEEQPGRDQVVLLSYGLWQRRFGADPNLVGKAVALNARSCTVVGIMSPGCQFPGGFGGIVGAYNKPADLWVPLALDANAWSQRSSHYLQVIARLKPGKGLEQARAEMNTLQHGIEQQYPNAFVGSHVKLIPLHTQMISGIRPALLVLLGAVAFVLLIACANVANLLLARARARHREMAIRAALGASRSRVIRQLLTESLPLAILGGVLGTLLALWGMEILVAASPGDIPRIKEVQIDDWVLGFTLLVSVLTGMIFGLAPALEASRPNLNESLREGGRSATEGLHRNRIQSLLVVGEVALALMLLAGAGLMIQSFLRLQQVDPGFRTGRLLTLDLTLPDAKYSKEQQQADFFRQLLARIQTLPGVQSVGAATALPLTGNRENYGIGIEGRPPEPLEKMPTAEYRAISPDYFGTLGIPLLKGRTFTERDRKDSPPVAVINESLARRYFADEEPLGKRLLIGHGRSQPQIVGVVGDVRHLGLDAEIQPEVYEPYLQVPWPSMTLAIRTSADPTSLAAAVRSEVLAIDTEQPLANVRTMDQILADSVAQPRFRTLLLGLFGAVALALAAVGIYGAISYSAAQRTHEIGIRMALGAQKRDVLKLVVRQGMLLTLTGVVIGLAGSFGLSRVLSSLLFGVTATDPATFVGVSSLLVGVALLASYLPARRATQVDPMVALRYE
jgi:putative ABC transport system permease protein